MINTNYKPLTELINYLELKEKILKPKPMKTAMQELIDYLEKQISEYPEDCQKGHIPRDVLNGMHHSNCNALAMAKKLVEKNKIELPSDEEIEQEAYYKVSDHTENPYASFKSGAKWIKEQILKQNK